MDLSCSGVIEGMCRSLYYVRVVEAILYQLCEWNN